MKKIISQSILVNPTLQHIHLSRNKIKCELSFKYIFKSIDSLLKLSQAIQQITYLSASAERRRMTHDFFPLKDLLHFQLWVKAMGCVSFLRRMLSLHISSLLLYFELGYFSRGQYAILLKILSSIFTANLHDTLIRPSACCQRALPHFSLNSR